MKRFILAVMVFLLASPCGLFAAENMADGRAPAGKSLSGEESLEKGIRNYKSENYEEAVEFFVDARSKIPSSSIAAYYLGLSYKQTGRYREAAVNFRDAINLSPSVKDAYTELIDVLYNLNELSEAKEWIKKAEKENVKPAHIAFLKGLILAKDGNTRGAVDAFNKARELDKSLSQAANLQIAMAYAKDRRIEEARESLKAVITIAPTSEMASFAKEYENALAKAMAAYRTWRLTANIAYQFDDNVVLKPSEAIPGVLITGERDSAIVSGVRLDYTPMLSGRTTFNAQYSINNTSYFRIAKLNLLTQSVTLNPGYTLQNGSITLPLTYTYVWLDQLQYQGILSLKPTLNIMATPDLIGQFSAGYAKRGQFNPVSAAEDRDGDIYSASAGLLSPISGGKGMYNLKYEFVRDYTDGQNWRNNGNRFSVGLLAPAMEDLSFTLSGEAFVQNYTREHTVFAKKRLDKTYSVSAGMIWEIMRNANFSLQMAHTTADSNITVYDYKRNVYTAGLEYNF